MNSRHSTLIYIAAVFITLLVVLAYDFLPQRRFLLLPNKDSWAYTNDDREVGGHSAAGFTTPDFSHWHCQLNTGADEPFCSIGVAMSRDTTDWTVGTDLSMYDQLLVDLRYEGDAKLVRIHIRNYDPLISNPEDYNSAKFNKINLRVSDLHKPILLNMHEFQLSDWWIDQFDIPRKWSQATFDRVTSIGFDFAQSAGMGSHDIEFHRIEFIGAYVDRNIWYLAIIVAWMLAILVLGISRLRDLHLRSLRDQRRLREMADYARAMKAEATTLQHQSRIDPLTGAYNRHGLQQIVETSFEFRRSGENIAIILLDIDHFKQINDHYGHSAGDKVLKVLGSLLLKNTRSFDSVARWGGEEFLLVCPHTTPDNALQLAEKVRLAVKQLTFDDHPDLQITASFGITGVVANEDFAKAFNRADVALYNAKHHGRDRCEMN